MLIEELFTKGGPRHMAEGMWLRSVSQKHPVAVHAIRSELADGKVLSAEELLAWMAERKREEERKRKKWEEQERRRREEEVEHDRLDREEWLAMDGLR